MIIIGGIVLELATIIGSIVINVNSSLNPILEIQKKGYKFDKDVLTEIQKEQKIKGENNTLKKVLGVVLLLIPGVNLLNAGIQRSRIKKAFMNDPLVQKAMIPMTEEEKENYSYMKGKAQKLAFMGFLNTKENDEEVIDFVGGSPLIVDSGASSIYSDALPFTYSLAEVKKLNDATTYSYRIGEIDNNPVAIIGIPNSNSPFKRIHFKDDDALAPYRDYKAYTEEDAKDKMFMVYPFMGSLANNEELKKCHDKILQEREIKENIETNDTFDYINEPSYEEDTTLEENGPVLRKKIKPDKK